MKHKRLIAGGLIAAELVLCGAILAASWQGIGAAQSSGLRLRVLQFDLVSAEVDEEHRASVNGPATLLIENPTGSLRVAAGADDQIVIGAHKTAWGASQAEAQAQLAALKVTVTQVGNRVSVRVESPREVTIAGSAQPEVVDFVVSVPQETRVTAHNSFGDISLSGTSLGADLRTSSGAILVEAAAGDLVLRSDFGDIRIERATSGAVEAHSGNGLVLLEQVRSDGQVRLTSDFGNVQFQNGRAGALDVETDNGQVELSSLAIARAVTVRSGFRNLTLSQVTAAAYDLRSDNGDILVDGAGGPIAAESQFGTIDVQNAESAVLDLSTSNGAIVFAGSLAGGPHRVTSEFGNLSLALPEDTALTVDLQTEFGSIESELPITVRGSAEPAHWRGTVNGGGPDLTAHTDNGTITLSILRP